MSPIAVIIPVKSGGGKSRLASVLTGEERRRLSTSLLGGVLSAVAGAGLGKDCYVVSSDEGALRAASRAGANPVQEPGDSGVNSAVRAGMRAATGADDFLVIPSDLPLVGPGDIRELVRLREGGMKVVLSPSAAFDGTNALVFPRKPRFPLSFDRDSFWNHLSAASRMGVPVGVCAREGIMFDVDSPDDLRRLAASGSRSRGAAVARGSAL